MTARWIHGNALALPLAAKSVHLIVTSPPYFSLRSYRDDGEHYDGQVGSEPSPGEFLAALWRVMDECWRVLRDDGSAWVNLGDKFAGSGGHNNAGISDRNLPGQSAKAAKRSAYLPGAGKVKATRRSAPDRYTQESGGLRPKSRMLLPHRFALGCQWPAYRVFEEVQAGLEPTVDAPQWIVRMDNVWSKKNGMPESVDDRCRAAHESWMHMTKSEQYFAAIDEVREAQTWGRQINPEWRKGREDWSDGAGAGTRHGKDGGLATINPLGKAPGSVWEVATEPLRTPEFMVSDGDDVGSPVVWLPKARDAWRWMADSGATTCAWPRRPCDGSEIRVAPDHFAAFPSEFPRRIVLGWSPSGVCVACGDPRRPVVEKELVGVWHDKAPQHSRHEGTKDEHQNNYYGQKSTFGSTAATITGYACSCPDTSAPTRPAVVLDPFSGTGTTAIVADSLGRFGVGGDLSADYLRLGLWRDGDGKTRAKALGVKPPPKVPVGQAALW